MTEDLGQTKELLAEAIVKIVGDSFSKWRQVVLLSYIGQSLARFGVDFRAILGTEKLAEFIRRELHKDITLISIPNEPLVWAAYPSDVELSKEIDPFGKPKRSSQEARRPHEQHRALIFREVWFAFSHPLAEGHERVLRLEPVIEYQDFPAGTDPRPGGYAVDQDLIVPAGSMEYEERNNKIYSNIQDWVKTVGIDFRTISKVRQDRTRARSLLDEILNALGPSELSRVSMPLDVVNTLRKKQI